MALLIGSTTIGLILALLALGIFISFRIFDFPDITAGEMAKMIDQWAAARASQLADNLGR